jgi:hypothetical protein
LGGFARKLYNKKANLNRVSDEVFLSLVEIEEIAGIYLESAGELEDIVETDILFSAFHFANEITVDVYHLAQLFLGQVPFRAYGTQTCAER